MSTLRIGIIGCGRRGQAHARAYAALGDVQLVACADPVREAAEALAAEQQIPLSSIYTDYQEMLARERLDVVSICTWDRAHTENVVDSVTAGVKGIFLEKPLAPTWGESKKLYQACVDGGVTLAVCHQRRFEPTFVKARELVNEGAIGELYRVEGFCSDLLGWGTHWLDMFFFYNNDQPAEWVMGQLSWEPDERQLARIAARPERFQPHESHGLAYIKWQNDVYGLLVTGRDADGRCANRLIGSEGIIELDVHWDHRIWGRKVEGPLVRVMRAGFARYETPELFYPSGEAYVGRSGEPMENALAIKDFIDALQTGREPELSGRKALQATELIFATYESSRRRGRVVLPLDIEDSPLEAMIESGEIGP